MNKKICLATVAALSLFTVAGVSAGIMTAVNNDKSVNEVMAVSNPVTEKFYLILDSATWGSATAYYTVHYFGGTTQTTWPGNTLTFNSATGAYEGTYDYTSTGFTLVRWGNEAHSTEWNRYEISCATKTVNCSKNTGWTSGDSYLVSETTFDTVFEAPSTYTTPYMHYWDTYTGLTTKAWTGYAMNAVTYPYAGVSVSGSTVYRLTQTLLSTGVTRSGFVFNNNGDATKTGNLYGSTYANAFSTTACLSDSTDRLDALDFLDYFQQLRINHDICWILSDSTALATLKSKYSGLSAGAKTLVDATNDVNSSITVTVGITMAMINSH